MVLVRKLVAGWYNETLPAFLQHFNSSESIEWLHLDCDTFSGHQQVLQALKAYLVPGSLLIFDDFLNYKGYEDYALRAFYDLVQEENWTFEVLVSPWKVEWDISWSPLGM